MSEVKRLEIVWYGEVIHVVKESDYESELSALREELAKSKAQLETWHNLDLQRDARLTAVQSELAALREELEAESKGADKAAEDLLRLNRLLTATEQRNAELVELLREVQKASRKQLWAHGYPVLFQLIDTVCAKPTESGASE